MRRNVTVALVGALVSLALMAEGLAASEAYVTVAPTRVKKSEPVTVSVNTCKSGSNANVGDYTATIEEDLTYPSGPVDHFSRPVDESDGTTEFTHNLPAVGNHKLKVWCKHTWSNGSGQPWTPEEFTVEVYEEGTTPTPTITDQERAKCKKLPTRRKRKRCLKKAALD
jgi:hypothetical protein